MLEPSRRQVESLWNLTKVSYLPEQANHRAVEMQVPALNSGQSCAV